ncbi:hypothetical protein BS78_01G176600, partial [Paspalum vaginatum]
SAETQHYGLPILSSPPHSAHTLQPTAATPAHPLPTRQARPFCFCPSGPRVRANQSRPSARAAACDDQARRLRRRRRRACHPTPAAAARVKASPNFQVPIPRSPNPSAFPRSDPEGSAEEGSQPHLRRYGPDRRSLAPW